ncbi:MAG: 3-dehydroquinate synthase, partial [Clostridia bacterium]
GVFFDINTLKTLPRREFSNGLAEAIKCGFIYDKSILNLLENDISETVLRSLKVKKHFLELDEFDTSERRILNFGHTYGHAVEKASDYSVFHGEAVAIGMCAVTMAAEYHKICENGTCEQLKKILAENNLPIKTDIPLKTIVEIMKIDKKSENDSIILILPKKIEKCIQYPIKKDELYDFFRCTI